MAHQYGTHVRENFQQQDGEERARDRSLIHTHSHVKLLTALITDPHTPLEHWSTCPFLGTEAPQVPPQDCPRQTIEVFLKVKQGKVELFVGAHVLLLQLANNEAVINGTSTRHKAEMNLIDAYHLADVEV